MTETLVKRVLIQDFGGKKTASGVELANGQKITAHRKIVLSAGAYRTPQLLLLSGIGPISEPSRHGVPQVVDAPEVGKNFHDHMAVSQWWKLRAPENGYTMGSPKFNDPAFMKGLPVDWVITQPYLTMVSKLLWPWTKATCMMVIRYCRLPDPTRNHTSCMLESTRLTQLSLWMALTLRPVLSAFCLHRAELSRWHQPIRKRRL